MAQSKAEKQRKRFLGHAMDMEVPLRDAAQYVVALRLMGEGLVEHDSEQGEAVVIVASAASHRLEALREAWDKACNAARK